MDDNSKFAIEYAARGWNVFPVHSVNNGKCSCGKANCKDAGKHPWTQNGLTDATNDLAKAEYYWRQHPNANIGLHTGRSGLFVVDCDIKPDADGYANWTNLAGQPDTLTAITGSGGRHLFFLDPQTWVADVKPSKGKIAPAIDVRCKESYVILAPSLHKSGNRYSWVDRNIQPAPMPDHIRQIVETAYTPIDPWGKPFTLRDALLPRPPTEYVLEKVLSLPSLNMFFGDGGSLKSFLLADLSLCIASGKTFLDPLPAKPGSGKPTLQSPVMWLDFDQGERRVAQRFASLARARRVADAPIYYYSMPSPWLDGGEPNAIKELCKRVLSHKVRFVVVDALGSVSGNADENSTDMARVMQGFRVLAETTDAAVALVHHANKPNGTSRKIGDTIRGHSSIKASLDTAFLVEREKQEPTITIRCAKSRDGDIDDFAAQFTYTHDANGELNEARFYSDTITDSKAVQKAQIEDELLAIVQNDDFSKRDLFKHVKGDWADKSVVLGNLVMLGKIVEKMGKRRNEKVYGKP